MPEAALQRSAAKVLEACRAFLWRQVDAEGVLRCPVHRVEHPGKAAHLLVDAVRCADPRAVLLARRLSATLRPHPREPGLFVFGAGPQEPRGLTNWPVDAASIAIGLARAARCGSVEAEVSEALRRVGRDYLARVVEGKRVVAQRAWAAWGLAESVRALGEAPAWERVLADAASRCARVRGYDEGGEPPGVGAASAFYGSRVGAFLALARAALGVVDPGADVELVAAALRLSDAILPDGTKCPRPEAKPWYFPAGPEEASAVFDLLLLTRALRCAPERSELARAASARLQRLEERVDATRGLLPAAPGEGAFQCTVFFAAHALLLGEIEAEDWSAVARSAGATEAATPSSWAVHAPEFARLRAPQLHAVWTIERGPAGPLHGNETGAWPAALWSAERGTTVRLAARGAGSGFEVRSSRGSWHAAWRALRGELRFALHLLRLGLGTPERTRARTRAWRRFASFLVACARSGSAWDPVSEGIAWRSEGGAETLVLRGASARHALELRIAVRAAGTRLAIRETLNGLAGADAPLPIRFRLPRDARRVRVDAPQREGGKLAWRAGNAPFRATVRYVLEGDSGIAVGGSDARVVPCPPRIPRGSSWRRSV